MVVGPTSVCLLLFSALCQVYSQTFIQPEQVHLSYGVDSTQMVVTWLTLSYVDAPSIVEFGPTKSLGLHTSGHQTNFTDGGSERIVRYVHRVTLENLKPGQRYLYHCGSEMGWSSLLYFDSMKNGSNWSPSLAVYGDLGTLNAQSLGRLQQETQAGMYDAVLHVGDMAYNMEYEQGNYGDQFSRQIESVAAYIPYMVTPGNHEAAYNFTHYRKRFTMPGGDGENTFYSFKLGPAHIISFSTELYYYLSPDWTRVKRQYEWLKNELEEANKPQNRAERPWIITMAHRPMYCSNNDHDDCTNNESIIRKGFPYIKAFGLEDLFYKYGVDVEIWAHEHSYERLWPVYDRRVCNGSYSEPYTEPGAPVHIITGSAGCYSKHDPFKPNPLPWTSFRTEDYGYTRINIIDGARMDIEQVSDDKGGQVVDKISIQKKAHGVGLYSCT